MDRHQLTAAQLRVGTLLAEGGEGRVYTVIGQPDVVYKAYRRPPPQPPLEDLVNWLVQLDATRPEMAARVRRSTAWPLALVTDPTGDRTAGLLMPRAPERFSLRHREGPSRLATLSYLTTDPAQRVAAYGLQLPDAVTAARVGVVYALARLLEATEAVEPVVSHGDLSGRNVLWSLARGPEVFVLDCDSSERFTPEGQLTRAVEDDGGDRRRRAMTPNWDDPAVPAGGNPGPASDRYSLALIFLRVVGAAHYPLQRRQREGQPITVDFEIPPQMRRIRAFASGAALWEVCQAGLQTTEPERRPAPSVWVQVLRDALEQLDDEVIISSVEANQSAAAAGSSGASEGGAAGAAGARDAFATRSARVAGAEGTPSGGPLTGAPRDALAASPPDVVVRPVAAEPRARRWSRITVTSPNPTRPGALTSAALSITSSPARVGSPPGTPAPGAANLGLWPQLRSQGATAVAWWLLLHRRMARALATRGRRRRGVRRLAFCVVVDMAVVSVTLFLVAMLVSPFLGI